MSETLIVTGVLGVYLVLLFAIAIWSRSETRTIEGYYLGSRRLPYWVAGLSANATGESGWLLLGLSGMGYLMGMHAIWIVVGEVLGMWLAWRVIARRLKIAADKYGSVTVPDFLDDALPGRSKSLRMAGIIIILSMAAAYVTAQMMATGKTFSTFLPMDYSTGVLIGGAITLAYTAYGGFKAVAYSDVLQGILMLLALIMLPIAGFVALRGNLWELLRDIDPVLLDISGGMGISTPGLIVMVGFVALGLAFMSVPQLLTRFMAINDPAEVDKAARVSVVCILVFDVGAVLTGMTGRILFPELADAETVLPTMARELFPPLLTGLILVMVLAAVMSTVDSLLILASSAVVRDLMQKVANLDWQDSQFAKVGKLVTIVIGVGSILFALADAKVVFWFVIFAMSGLAAAFGPVVFCILFWRGITKQGALAGMIGGFATDMIWASWIKPYAFEMVEIIPALIVGFLLIYVVSRATQGQWSAST